MGVGSVIGTFVMCILFNIILPSGDQGSDIYLMYNVLTFQLGVSVELSGCRACYGKNENEIYDSKIQFIEQKNCNNLCIQDKHFYCGRYPKLVNNIFDHQNSKKCLTKNIRFNNKFELKSGDCDELDYCCVKPNNNLVNNTQKTINLDPKILVRCDYYNNEFDFCYTFGKANYYYCYSLRRSDPDFYNKRNKMFKTNNKQTYKFDKASDSDTNNLNIKPTNITYNDKCGFYFKPKSSERHIYCNEDVCLTHIKSLHYQTDIYDYENWKNTTVFNYGVRIGGPVCQLLSIYGYTIIIPILLNLFFNVVIFIQDYRLGKANKFEILPLVFFLYPQYKTIKMLVKYLFVHRDEEVLNQEKDENDMVIAPLEPYLESCIQVHFNIYKYIIYNEKIKSIKKYQFFRFLLTL